MQVNKINSTQNFGMNLFADETFWADVNYQLWSKGEKNVPKKLLKQLEKIENYPLKDTYEIQKVSNTIQKPVENNIFQKFQTLLEDGYMLIDKTKNKVVLKQTKTNPIKKYYIPEIEQADFIETISKNLKKLMKIEKIK